jgi:hypothetical protein
MYFTVDTSPMVSLSYRLFCPMLRSWYWVTGEQVRESQARHRANLLAESGAMAVHWENM